MTTDFEYSVIGAICIDSRIIEKITPILSADDFTITACADIYEAATDAVSRGKAFDSVYAADVISKTVINPTDFVKECMDLCPSCVNAEFHAREVHKQAQMRNLNTLISEKLFYGENTDPQTFAADIVGVCQNFLTTGNAKRYSTMCESVAKVYDRVTSPQKVERIDTGFTRLDAILKGLPKGSLTFIGARPAVGKSAFALSVSEYVAKTYGTTMLYSLEMTDEENAERLISKRSGVSMDKLIDNDVTEDDLCTLTTICGNLSNIPLCIYDNPNAKPSDIRKDYRALKNVKLIVVDYIGLMDSDRKFRDNRNLELGAISRDLKNLAKELDVPIVCLSQLNREKGENEEPTLRDLRDSGELEQNASKVIFLWELKAFDDGTKNVGVSVAKNRRGRLGAVKNEFNGAYMLFTETDYLTQEERKQQKKPKRSSAVFDEED